MTDKSVTEETALDVIYSEAVTRGIAALKDLVNMIFDLLTLYRQHAALEI